MQDQEPISLQHYTSDAVPIPPTPPFSILHFGHSSVLQTPFGTYLEIRRGFQRFQEIPDPTIWNSLEEWHIQTNQIAWTLPPRIFPSYFTPDQLWYAQWHETSTLDYVPDAHGCYSLQPVAPPVLFIADKNTGQFYPLYMNLQSGSMMVNNCTFTTLAESPFSIVQVWRAEMDTYYRVY